MPYDGTVPMQRWGFTGHRNLGGFGPSVMQQWVKREVGKFFQRVRPMEVFIGMALGADLIAAEECVRLKIPFIAVLPYIGQERAWGAAQQNWYQSVLKHARGTMVVSAGGHTNAKLHRRNHVIVDRCEKLLAVWDGREGGTAQCIDYAQENERDITVLDPVTRTEFKLIGTVKVSPRNTPTRK